VCTLAPGLAPCLLRAVNMIVPDASPTLHSAIFTADPSGRFLFTTSLTSNTCKTMCVCETCQRWEAALSLSLPSLSLSLPLSLSLSLSPSLALPPILSPQCPWPVRCPRGGLYLCCYGRIVSFLSGQVPRCRTLTTRLRFCVPGRRESMATKSGVVFSAIVLAPLCPSLPGVY